ncbi:large conductance mechanosensitive channel [Scopulibacillus darangshiensis]|uniref:Large-conductance mechanosensitive channel n=1 Tax=Scopulibacillus darangshiensis TaxID=442528 RepID=A0A4R2P4Z1_9BACL|nr:large conductance mechanosensitive channel protein MscL [Scopulibacillus darangshiensis]TCP29832.1 large conductance mechanosensitive channel [Scopulibacillus darangshiensis]
MFKEFKAFLSRGNVIDLAIAVIIGAAFGKIVTSIVNDIIMPPIGLLLGKVDFSNLYINLSDKDYASLAEAQKAGAPTINYGLFINTVINFIIIAFVIFLVIKLFERFKKKEEAAAPTTKKCPYCLSEVPQEATKCAHCTSEIGAEPSSSPQN